MVWGRGGEGRGGEGRGGEGRGGEGRGGEGRGGKVKCGNNVLTSDNLSVGPHCSVLQVMNSGAETGGWEQDCLMVYLAL